MNWTGLSASRAVNGPAMAKHNTVHLPPSLLAQGIFYIVFDHLDTISYFGDL